MKTKRSPAVELGSLAATMAGNYVSRALNALIPSNADRRARFQATLGLEPTVCNGFSPADIQAMMDGRTLPGPIAPTVGVWATKPQLEVPGTAGHDFDLFPQTPARPSGEQPTGAGPNPPSGTGAAAPYQPTSELLFAAANQLDKARGHHGSIGYLYLAELIPELRDRAAQFDAAGD